MAVCNQSITELEQKNFTLLARSRNGIVHFSLRMGRFTWFLLMEYRVYVLLTAGSVYPYVNKLTFV